MYYEEKVIDGILCWRGTPDGEWKQKTQPQLSEMVESLRAKLAEYESMVNDEAAMWVNHLRGTIKLPIERMREEIERPLKAKLQRYERMSESGESLGEALDLREIVMELEARVAMCVNFIKSFADAGKTSAKVFLSSILPNASKWAEVIRTAQMESARHSSNLPGGMKMCRCDFCNAVRAAKENN